MSTQSSGSGSDTSLDSHEPLSSNLAGSKRKSVIDTRRAEQNRAAQRAFRQRKEVYLKELEAKVRDMEILKDRVNRLEMENERLKYRVWELESSPTSTTSTSAPTSSSSNSSSNSYHKSHAGANDLTSGSGDSQQRQQQQQQQPWLLSPTDTTPKAIQTTKPALPSLPSSSPSLSPPTPQHATGSTSSMPLHILPPPSPSPSVFRPIPVAYWEKESSGHKRHRSTTNDCQQQQQQKQQYPSQRRLVKEDTTPSEHGQVLDDLASILRTRHRPPIRQQLQPIKPEPMHS